MASVARSYETNVFINCPFDPEYKPIFDAITFAIFDAGYLARTALEENNTATERHTKIAKLIRECKYGIHDISRVERDPNSELPRLNMAYECGLFYGAQVFGTGIQKKKEILVLDSAPFRYRQTLSDIAGRDAETHSNDPFEAIAKVRNFLTNKERGKLAGAVKMQKRYQSFLAGLPAIAEEASCTLDEIKSLPYWREFAAAVTEWIKTHP